MDFELKETSQGQVKIDGTSLFVTQGFTTGPVGCPADYKMVCGDTIVVEVENSGSKTQDQINTEVNTAVNDYITANYPTV